MLRVVLLCFFVLSLAPACYAQSIFDIYDVSKGDVADKIERAKVSSISLNTKSKSQHIGLLFVKMYQAQKRRRYLEVEKLLKRISAQIDAPDAGVEKITFNPNDKKGSVKGVLAKMLSASESGKEVVFEADSQFQEQLNTEIEKNFSKQAESMAGTSNGSFGTELFDDGYVHLFEKLPSGAIDNYVLKVALKDSLLKISKALRSGRASSAGKYFSRAIMPVSEMVVRERKGYLTYPALFARFCSKIPREREDRIKVSNSITAELYKIPKNKQDSFFHAGLRCYQATVNIHDEAFERFLNDFKRKYAASKRGKLMLSYIHFIHATELVERLEIEADREKLGAEFAMSILPLLPEQERHAIAEEIFSSLMYYIASGANVPHHQKDLESMYGYFSRFLYCL